MIKEIITNHIKVSNYLLNDIESIKNLCTLAQSTILSKNKILLCGNGGSASDASHIAAEFVGKFNQDRSSLPAIALSDNASSLTSIGNDYGFDEIFSRQIDALGNENDLLIAISTSGNSQNVINAINIAKKLEMKCVILTGSNGGKMSSLGCDIIKINSKNTARIQEMHILIGHIMCAYVDENI